MDLTVSPRVRRGAMDVRANNLDDIFRTAKESRDERDMRTARLLLPPSTARYTRRASGSAHATVQRRARHVTVRVRTCIASRGRTPRVPFPRTIAPAYNT